MQPFRNKIKIKHKCGTQSGCMCMRGRGCVFEREGLLRDNRNKIKHKCGTES